MKYMHFPASCSYAALAMLLEYHGIDTEDSNIALELGLPWLFHREGNAFLAGPMLQGPDWFDLWLRPRGFRFAEEFVSREALCQAFPALPLMLGLATPYGKHAVVLTGYDGRYRFQNPTWEQSGEATELALTETELLGAVDETVALGRVIPAEPAAVTPPFAASLQVLRENVAAIEAFASRPHPPEAYRAALDPLFRPLLLDGVSMLTLAGESSLAEELRGLQGALMEFLRGGCAGLLRDALSLDALHSAAERYCACIARAARKAESAHTPESLSRSL